MDLYIEAGLWVGIIAGGFALLGLVAEGVERFAAWFDRWLDSICEAYVDE